MYKITQQPEGFGIIQNTKTQNEVLIMRKGTKKLLIDINSQNEMIVDSEKPLLTLKRVIRFLSQTN